MLKNQVPDALKKDFYSLPFEYRDLVSAIIEECSLSFENELNNYYEELKECEYEYDRESV